MGRAQVQRSDDEQQGAAGEWFGSVQMLIGRVRYGHAQRASENLSLESYKPVGESTGA